MPLAQLKEKGLADKQTYFLISKLIQLFTSIKLRVINLFIVLNIMFGKHPVKICNLLRQLPPLYIPIQQPWFANPAGIML